MCNTSQKERESFKTKIFDKEHGEGYTAALVDEGITAAYEKYLEEQKVLNEEGVCWEKYDEEKRLGSEERRDFENDVTINSKGAASLLWEQGVIKRTNYQMGETLDDETRARRITIENDISYAEGEMRKNKYEPLTFETASVATDYILDKITAEEACIQVFNGRTTKFNQGEFTTQTEEKLFNEYMESLYEIEI
ncbi:MAG: hypothetical protein A2Y24_00440 [Clostridiales bacterium GWE2_32_10]|nr:MAG: hypothetical protein A2Y24_00440 [Clostridiales bacterium GWE2_32_10]HBY21533.1 hypothetical protein [Clostridiales bacterium]